MEDGSQDSPSKARASRWLTRLGTPLAIAFFSAMAISGLMMFFHQGGRFVSAMHEWLGLVFIGSIALHVARNVGPLGRHLRTRSLWASVGVMLALASLFVVPAVMGPPKPGHSVKAFAARARGASLARVAALLGVTSDTLRRSLTARGLTLPHADASLDAIGQASGRSGLQVLDLVMDALPRRRP